MNFVTLKHFSFGDIECRPQALIWYRMQTTGFSYSKYYLHTPLGTLVFFLGFYIFIYEVTVIKWKLWTPMCQLEIATKLTRAYKCMSIIYLPTTSLPCPVGRLSFRGHCSLGSLFPQLYTQLINTCEEIQVLLYPWDSGSLQWVLHRQQQLLKTKVGCCQVRRKQ